MKAPLRIWAISCEETLGYWVTAGRLVDGVVRENISRKIPRELALAIAPRLIEQSRLLRLHTNERLSK